MHKAKAFFFLCAGILLITLASGAVAETNPPSRTVSVSSIRFGHDETARSGLNLILNGDFENTGASGCNYGLSNAVFTAAMANSNAFGGGEELDIMKDAAGCSYLGPPQSGQIKVGMSSQEAAGASDAFALELSSSVEAGLAYVVSFYGWAYAHDFAPDLGPIEIGLSSDPSGFGTLIFAATPNGSGWTLFSSVFVAPASATYLTVRQANVGDIWNQVDNFSLIPDETVPVRGTSWGILKVIYR